MTYTISQIKPSDFDRALHFTCEHFVSGSVLHNSSGVSLKDYIVYLRNAFYDMANSGIALVATNPDTDEITGCLLAHDILAKVTPPEISLPELDPLNALLHSLEAPYIKSAKITQGDVLKVDIAVVAPHARGRGIYEQLRPSAQEAAAMAGYRRVVGELSSKATQSLCVGKWKQRVLNEIEYAQFEYKNRLPFAHIREPVSIQLVEGDCR